jgi:hypothetical protein
MSDYPIGGTIEHKNEQYRVVRIIGQSVSLFEDEKGTYLQTESYVELKGADGSIDFVSLTLERTPYEGGSSIIKGLEPINFGGGV